MTLYEGVLANYNSLVFNYESAHSDDEQASWEAYRIVNMPPYELTDFECEIQQEYLVNNEETIDVGDIIAVDGIPWVCTLTTLKKI